MTGKANPPLRTVLIGGTSHAGKSTLARVLARELGFEAVSTDSLGRHPGRPWPAGKPVPPNVVRHYATLPVNQLMRSVLVHYRNMWPGIAALIRSHPGLVLEGSALLPENVATIAGDGLRAVWLSAGAEFLTARIARESGYETASADGRHLIEKFTARAIAFDRLMADDCTRLQLPVIDVEQASSPDELVRAVLGQRTR